MRLADWYRYLLPLMIIASKRLRHSSIVLLLGIRYSRNELLSLLRDCGGVPLIMFSVIRNKNGDSTSVPVQFPIPYGRGGLFDGCCTERYISGTKMNQLFK